MNDRNPVVLDGEDRRPALDRERAREPNREPAGEAEPLRRIGGIVARQPRQPERGESERGEDETLDADPDPRRRRQAGENRVPAGSAPR